ncbi:hypothetical protein CKAH01_16469 [Colletotrichum kahawae]|uniref:Uncharacterized protein n=1 Tax=Colletotrichum kahawae TaxID=34407 RepID=A0AAE0D687_COLKA|nr:hypothetical protein CKAH01_16469 [Colletotrichum kahawae]
MSSPMSSVGSVVFTANDVVDVAVANVSSKDAEGKIGTVVKVEGTEAGANEVDELVAEPLFCTAGDDAPAEIEGVWVGPVGLMNDAPSASVFCKLEAGADDVEELVAGPLLWTKGDDAPADMEGIELGAGGLMKDAPRASLFSKLEADVVAPAEEKKPLDEEGMVDPGPDKLADAIPELPEMEILRMLDEPGVLWMPGTLAMLGVFDIAGAVWLSGMTGVDWLFDAAGVVEDNLIDEFVKGNGGENVLRLLLGTSVGNCPERDGPSPWLLAVVEIPGLGVDSGAPLLVIEESISDDASGVVLEEELNDVAAPVNVVVVTELMSPDWPVETRGSVELPEIAVEVEKDGSEDDDRISSLLDCVLLASLLELGLLVVSDSGTGVVNASVDETLLGDVGTTSLLVPISPAKELVAVLVTEVLELMAASVDDTVMLVPEAPVAAGFDVDENSSAVLLLPEVTDVLEMKSELEVSELVAALELWVKPVLELELDSRELEGSDVELDVVLELDVVSELNSVLEAVLDAGLGAVLDAVLDAVSDVELDSSIGLVTVDGGGRVV